MFSLNRPDLSLICSLFVLCTIVSCTNTESVTEEEFGITTTYQVNKKTGEKDGSYTKHGPDGELVETGEYTAGVLEGERTLFFKEGGKEIVETYSNGTLQGLYQTFYQNGSVDIEGEYTEGVMKGTWKRHYDNGQLMEEVTFEDNLENGPFIEYHPNGKLKAEGQYYMGDNEHGLLKLYDENGELMRRMECDSGICHTVWVRPGVEEETEVNE